MITLHSKLSRALREELVRIVISGLLKYTNVNKMSNDLGIHKATIHYIQRAMCFGDVGYIRQVYKGLKSENELSKDFRGKKHNEVKRTIQEAYAFVHGTIADSNTQMFRDLIAEADKRKAAKLQRMKPVKKTIEVKKVVKDVKQPTKVESMVKGLIKDAITTDVKKITSPKPFIQETPNQSTITLTIRTIEGLSITATLTKGSQLIIANK